VVELELAMLLLAVLVLVSAVRVVLHPKSATLRVSAAMGVSIGFIGGSS